MERPAISAIAVLAPSSVAAITAATTTRRTRRCLRVPRATVRLARTVLTAEPECPPRFRERIGSIEPPTFGSCDLLSILYPGNSWVNQGVLN